VYCSAVCELSNQNFYQNNERNRSLFDDEIFLSIPCTDMLSTGTVCAISTFHGWSGESAKFIAPHGDGVIVQPNVQHEWDDVVM
jgi:hypothetical protein